MPLSLHPMLISVVIPVRNGRRTLPGQLEALVRQNYTPECEVVIADNGSNDGTLDIVRSWRERIPRLRVVDASARPGRPFACNVGAHESTGDALLFVDDDDEVAPGYLDAMATALRRYDLVASRLDHGALNHEWLRRSREPIQSDGPIDIFRFLPFGAGCSLGVRRSVFESVGGFDETMYRVEDIDFCWRLALAGVPLHFVPDAVVRYRYRDGLRAIYRQARENGRGDTILYRRYRSAGMSGMSLQQAWAEWRRLLWLLPRTRTKSDWALVLRVLGIRVGRLRGSLRNRVFYL